MQELEKVADITADVNDEIQVEVAENRAKDEEEKARLEAEAAQAKMAAETNVRVDPSSAGSGGTRGAGGVPLPAPVRRQPIISSSAKDDEPPVAKRARQK